MLTLTYKGEIDSSRRKFGEKDKQKQVCKLNSFFWKDDCQVLIYCICVQVQTAFYFENYF
jgi:hypothetical protein